MSSVIEQADILARLLPPVSYAPNAAGVAAELRLAGVLLEEAWQAARLLRAEADPRSTYDLLDEFEDAYGLPDLCGEIELTLNGRRLAVLAKMSELGGQTPAFYEAIAGALGYPDARVVEYRPMTCEDSCVSALAADGWRNVWAIATDSELRVTELTCEGPCNEPLADWGLIEPLQCTMNRLKPAHTIVYFDFGS